jgi:hypothetical protein
MVNIISADSSEHFPGLEESGATTLYFQTEVFLPLDTMASRLTGGWGINLASRPEYADDILANGFDTMDAHYRVVPGIVENPDGGSPIAYTLTIQVTPRNKGSDLPRTVFFQNIVDFSSKHGFDNTVQAFYSDGRTVSYTQGLNNSNNGSNVPILMNLVHDIKSGFDRAIAP